LNLSSNEIIEVTNRFDLPKGNIKRLRLATSRIAWLVAGGRVMISLDSGCTWHDRTPANFPADYLQSKAISAINSSTCWLLASYASMDLRILHTTDSGNTWSENRRLFAQKRFIVAENIEFVDENHGWVLFSEANGNRMQSTLWRTVDGGHQWTELQLKTSGTLQQTGFISPTMGWICEVRFAMKRNRYTTIFHSTNDGGLTWETVSRLKGKVLDMCVLPTGKIVVCGARGLVAYSSDSGRTWAISEPCTRMAVESLDIRGELGIAAGTSDLIHSTRSVVLLLTRNGGRIWRRLPSPIQAAVVNVFLTGWESGIIASPESVYRFRIRRTVAT
jgi:photosystem II stability/assembly factor-like uncharacterized protein